MTYKEYSVLTATEIEDLAMCKSIQNGAYDEVQIYEGSYIPDLR